MPVTFWLFISGVGVFALWLILARIRADGARARDAEAAEKHIEAANVRDAIDDDVALRDRDELVAGVRRPTDD